MEPAQRLVMLTLAAPRVPVTPVTPLTLLAPLAPAIAQAEDRPAASLAPVEVVARGVPAYRASLQDLPAAEVKRGADNALRGQVKRSSSASPPERVGPLPIALPPDFDAGPAAEPSVAQAVSTASPPGGGAGWGASDAIAGPLPMPAVATALPTLPSGWGWLSAERRRSARSAPTVGAMPAVLPTAVSLGVATGTTGQADAAPAEPAGCANPAQAPTPAASARPEDSCTTADANGL